MISANTPPDLWNGVRPHVASLSILLIIVSIVWVVLGKPFPVAFWVAIAVPVVHQFFVWLTWRLELNSSATSRVIGFRGFLVVFYILFGGRLISLLVLGWIDRGSLELGFLPQIIIAMILAVPGFYAIYSVKRYFGFMRAAGADHFYQRFRDMPLVARGIFRFSNNGMYLYAFLLFWAVAVSFNSIAALVVAAFNHTYIWVHFFATEKPNMDYLYADD